MPYAMGPKRNTQKPKENIDFSWSGGDRGRTWEDFFSCFFGFGRVVVDFGARFGDFGAHLGGFGTFFGGFGWPLGAERVDQGTLARCGRSRPVCE